MVADRVASATNASSDGTHSADAVQLSQPTSVDFSPPLLLPPTTHLSFNPPPALPCWVESRGSPAPFPSLRLLLPPLSSTRFHYFLLYIFCFTTAGGGGIHHPAVTTPSPLLCHPALCSSFAHHRPSGGALSWLLIGHLASVTWFFSFEFPTIVIFSTPFLRCVFIGGG